MEMISRLLGFAVASAGTLSQLAAVTLTPPFVPRHWTSPHGGYPPPPIYAGWGPFIENLDSDDQASETPRCPGRQMAGTTFRLEHAPLPRGYVPSDEGASVLACVRVDAAGSVRSVKLIATTGKHSLDRQLVRTIEREWNFVPRDEVPVRPGWQRIRLSGPPFAAETLLPV
jgi:hypothetical protein